MSFKNPHCIKTIWSYKLLINPNEDRKVEFFNLLGCMWNIFYNYSVASKKQAEL